MIKIFSGKWRGLGEQEKGFGMIIDFRFREVLCQFRGAKLAVFLALALHSNSDGESWPTVDTLARETDYDTGTISTVTDELCAIRINGQRVLAKKRLRDERGHFTGSIRYTIFPDATEKDKAEPSSPLPGFPTSGENPLVAKPGTKLNQKTKDKPIRAETEMTPEQHEEYMGVLRQFSADELEDLMRRVPECRALGVVNMDEWPYWLYEIIPFNQMLKEKIRGAKVRDLSSVQHFADEEVINIVLEFHDLWQIPVPSESRADRSRVKDWYNGAKQIASVCQGHDVVDVMRAFKKWRDECDPNHEVMISRPGSIVNMLAAFIPNYKPAANQQMFFDEHGDQIIYG